MHTHHHTLIIASISFPWGMHRQMLHQRLQQLHFQRWPGIKNNQQRHEQTNRATALPFGYVLEKDTGISTWFFLEYPLNAHAFPKVTMMPFQARSYCCYSFCSIDHTEVIYVLKNDLESI